MPMAALSAIGHPVVSYGVVPDIHSLPCAGDLGGADGVALGHKFGGIISLESALAVIAAIVEAIIWVLGS